jgi:glucose-6-phosphate isomerase
MTYAERFMLTQTKSFATLCDHARRLGDIKLADLIYDTARARQLVFTSDDLEVDIARQHIDMAAFEALLGLAEDANIAEKRDAMFAGEAINKSENRPVVHAALRSPETRASARYQKMADFAEDTRKAGTYDDIINIGIGGSDLGPAMVAMALAPFASGARVHYVSNVDPSHLHDVLARCAAPRSLVIVTSKTFTTAETMRNARLAQAWLEAGGGDSNSQMAAVTAAADKAADWGIDPAQIFDFEAGVGGRYSLWSAVGLPVMLAIGADQFASFLDGGASMDTHFKTMPLARNIPVLLGLLRVWNRNFMGYPTHGIMPYDQRLARVPAWAQQLEMESNGKSVSCDGAALDYATAPVIWGEAGTGCQHSFFQALHQGRDIVPLDIIFPRHPVGLHMADKWPDSGWQDSHQVLVVNALAQAEALALGRENAELPHKNFTGGRPSTVMSWDQTTPFALGRLLALYEHVTIVSGFLWDVNSFDQWGVELGKEMATSFEAHLKAGTIPDGMSPTAADLLARLATKA